MIKRLSVLILVTFAPATLSAQSRAESLEEHPIGYQGARHMVDEFLAGRSLLAIWRSGDANPCPQPGTWRDSVFVMLNETTTLTTDHAFSIVTGWRDRVERCSDERAMAWYRRHAAEYRGAGMDLYVRILSSDPLGSRDALLQIAAEGRHPMRARSSALEAAVAASSDPLYRADAIAEVWEEAAELPSPFIWEELTRLHGVAGVSLGSRDKEAVERIARAVADHPSANQALGLTTHLLDIAERMPGSRTLVTPLRQLVEALRAQGGDTASLDALEARVNRLGGGR